MNPASKTFIHKNYSNRAPRIPWFLTIILLVVALVSGRAADAPILFHAQGSMIKTLWGDGFSVESEVLGDKLEATEEQIRSAIAGSEYRREDHLPDAPSKEAKPIQVLDRDPEGRVLAVLAAASGPGANDWTVGPDLLWVRNGELTSLPLTPTIANPWWAFPDLANAGSTITIYGRNLVSSKGLVALKQAGSAEPVILTPLRGGTYRVQVALPGDLAPGEYSVYFHNSRGGKAGWGGPISLTVREPSKGDRPFVSVTDFGAKGQGAGDDTEAIQKALDAASGKGAIVVLPPGNFPVSATLKVPEGVVLRGAGPGATILQVHPENPFRSGFPVDADIRGYARDYFPHLDSSDYVGKDGYGPMVWLQNRCGLENLTLLPGNHSGTGILVAREGEEPGREISIRRVNVEIHHQPGGWMTPYYIAVFSANEYLQVEDCEFRGAGGIAMHSAGHRQVLFARNRITGIPQGERNLLFLRSLSESVVENNHIRDGDRNIVYQSARRLAKEEVPEGRQNSSGSSKHNIYFKNIFENNVPRDHNAGEIMFEVNDQFWGGNGVEFTPDGFRVAGEPFNADLVGNFAVVLDGKGVGQFREIIAQTDNSLTLDRPWDVVPDAKSYLKVGAAAVECLWIDNTDYHIANWTGLWGNNIGNVIDGHIQHGGGGLFLWSPSGPDSPNPRPTLFNDFINCRIIGRGNIVLRGHFVLGNTVRFCEVVGFRYRPNYHGAKPWTRKPGEFNPGDRAAVSLEIDPWDRKISFENLHSTTNYMAWNVIEMNHIYDGPHGIRVDPDARHILIRANTINVDGENILAEEGSVVKP